MNQKDLAAILGVQESAISQYETDRSDPSDKIKADIAKCLDVSLDYLLGVIDDEVPYYSKNAFLMMPKGMTNEDEELAQKFLDFLVFRRNDLTNSG